MMVDTDDENIDKSQYVEWSDTDPMIKPERVKKGDIITGKECEECKGTGREEISKIICRKCKGKGWIGTINASLVGNLSEIRFAQIHVQNVLNYLWEIDVITEQHHHDAGTFHIWRDMHQASMGLRKSVSSGGGESLGIRLRAYGYVLLTKRLSRYDQKAIDQAIDTNATEYARELAYRQREIYRRALDRLSLQVAPVKEQIHFLEGLSEDERSALSEERLQKLVSEIKNPL